MKKFVEVHSITIILFIIIAVFYAFAVNTSGDTFYFMSKGREVWEAKSLPDTSDRTYGTYDKSLVLVEWIAGLIYYFAFSAFDLNGLTAVRIIIALSTLFFVFLVVWYNFYCLTTEKLKYFLFVVLYKWRKKNGS